MAKNMYRKGESLLYRNDTAATIPSGTLVVFGSIVGVAVNDIPPGEEEPVAVEHVWDYPGNFTAAAARGTLVYFDAAADIITDDTDGVPAGILAKDAVSGAGTVYVKLNVFPVA